MPRSGTSTIDAHHPPRLLTVKSTDRHVNHVRRIGRKYVLYSSKEGEKRKRVKARKRRKKKEKKRKKIGLRYTSTITVRCRCWYG